MGFHCCYISVNLSIWLEALAPLHSINWNFTGGFHYTNLLLILPITSTRPSFSRIMLLGVFRVHATRTAHRGFHHQSLFSGNQIYAGNVQHKHLHLILITSHFASVISASATRHRLPSGQYQWLHQASFLSGHDPQAAQLTGPRHSARTCHNHGIHPCILSYVPLIRVHPH